MTTLQVATARLALSTTAQVATSRALAAFTIREQVALLVLRAKWSERADG